MRALLLVCSTVIAFSMMPQSVRLPDKPLSFDLQCPVSDCALLKGTPQTAGMRSGFVRLKPGESVGAHSTDDHEEALVILQGQGKAEVEGRDAVTVSTRRLIYIPPHARHNVTNTGSEMLEYVYVVAPISQGH